MNEWNPPPSQLTLPPSEVHLWKVELAPAPAQLDSLYTVLASDEQAKAERFHFPKDKTRYIMARGILRILLGRYLEKPPGSLNFTYNLYGKPALDSQFSEETLQFNLSHSGSLALYVIAWQRKVGIDVEVLRSDLDWLPIAERFFSSAEVTSIRQLPQTEQSHAFFRCWTRKEAYIKATGKGLSMPLDQFEVSVGATQAVTLTTRQHPEEAARWSLQALSLGSGYVGAIAVEGHDHHLQYWQFPGFAGMDE